jgi:DNA-binding XRE family transcriptional regulator
MLFLMSRNPEEPVYNRIEEARAALGLSRQDLADKAGVHYQTIGYLEREEYSPSLVLALRIAKSLNQEVSELFSLTPLKVLLKRALRHCLMTRIRNSDGSDHRRIEEFS